MSTNLTPVAIDTLNRAQLTRVYNQLADRPVKAFSTLTIARERTAAALAAVDFVVYWDGADVVAGSAPAVPTDSPLPDGVGTAVDTSTPALPAEAGALTAPGADEVIDPANLPELTTLEHRMLTALVNSDFHDGVDPVGHAVWGFSAWDISGIKERSRGGVVASLVQKGFVTLSTHDKPDDLMTLTRRGKVALDSSEAPVEPAQPAPGVIPDLKGPVTSSRDVHELPPGHEPKPASPPRAASAAGPRIAGGRVLLDPVTRRGPLPSFDDGARIYKLVTANPKREGAATHAMFEIYRDGMTVAAYVAAGGRRRELNWDVRNGWVQVRSDKV